MDVAQHRDQAELAQVAQIALFSDPQGGAVARDRQLQADVIGQQPMVAAPALQGQAQAGRADRGARQHAVAAPGQAPAEPTQRLVVELLHGGARDAFHLRGGDASQRVDQGCWRNLCQRERLRRVLVLAHVGLHNGIDKGDGRDGRADVQIGGGE